MVEKRVAVRLVSEGGNLVRAEMQGIGRDGKQAFEQVALGQKSAASSAEVFTQAINAEAASFQQLRASLDPVYASSQRYEAVQQQVNAAIQKGITSQAEANRVMDMAAQRYLGATTALTPVRGAADRAAGGMKNMGQVAGQLSFQVQDFFVQMASGQSLFMAFAQQAPQAAGAFSMLGGRLGAVIPYVGTFIAIGAAVAPLFLHMGEKAKTAEERIDDLQSSLNNYQSAAAEATMSTEDLREKYGDLAEEVRAALVARMEEAAYEANEKLKTALTGVGDKFMDLIDKIGLSANRATLFDMQAARNSLRTLAEDFKLPEEAALRLKAAFATLDAAEDPGVRGAAAAELQRLLLDAYGTMQAMPKAVAQVYSQLTDVVVTGGAMSAQMTASEDAARRLAGLDISSGISAAAVEALALASALGLSLDKARAIAGAKEGRFGFGLGSAPVEGSGNVGLSFDGSNNDRYRYVEPFNLGTPGSAVAPIVSPRPESRSLEAMDNFYWEQGEPARRAAKEAQSDADKSANDAKRKAKQHQQEMLREAESTYEAQRTLREKYEDDVRRLDELLAAGAFEGFGGKETYNRAFEDLTDGFQKASQEANKARGVFADTFSSVVRGAESTGDVLNNMLDQWADRLLNDLGGSIFDSLFGGIGGGAKGGAGAGAGGGGNWWNKLLSFDGGGDTHGGPRSGGLDGKGGFLAMLHPQETVTDHTKGQRSAPGVVEYNININGATGNAEVRDMVNMGVQKAMRESNALLPAKVRRINEKPRRS